MAGLPVFSDSWDFYPRMIEDKSYTVRFDVGMLRLPDERRAEFPHTAVLGIPYREAHDNGFPVRGEMERINAIEDLFALRDDSVRHIGVLTGDGAVRFVFCGGGGSDKLEAMLHRLMSDKKTEYFIDVFQDDNLGFFDQLLAPTLHERNWMWDRQVCDSLRRNGDSLTIPREIDFLLCFKNADDMNAVSSKLLEQGFAEKSREERENGEFALGMTLDAVPALESINEITTDILNCLEGMDAYFDGWGCAVLVGQEKRV